MERSTIGVVASFVVALISHAQPVVHRWVNDLPGELATITPGDPVPIEITPARTLVYIWADSTSVDIGPITVTGFTAQGGNAHVVVANPGSPPDFMVPDEQTFLASACRDWYGLRIDPNSLSDLSGVLRVSGAISRDLLAHPQGQGGIAIESDRVPRLIVGQDVRGFVLASSTASSEFVIGGVDIGRSITTTGKLEVGGFVNRTFVGATNGIAGRGVFGPVVSTAGTINLLQSFGPIVLPTGQKIAATNGINTLIARDENNVLQAINAEIDADSDNNLSGDLLELRAASLSKPVHADSIGNVLSNSPGIHVSGVVSAPIIVAAGVRSPIHVGSVTATEGLVIQGDLSDDIVATGAITKIAITGDIAGGTSSEYPILIQAPSIGELTFNRILTTDPNEIFEAEVRADSIGSLRCEGWIGLLRGSTTEFVDIGELVVGTDPCNRPDNTYGNFEGSFLIDDFDRIEIAGSLYDHTGPPRGMYLTSVPPTSVVRIGQELVNRLDLLYDGELLGQIIIGSSAYYNNNPPCGFVPPAWSDDVVMDFNQTMTPRPHYEQTSIEFGGGSVGLVPYAMHRADIAWTTYTNDDDAGQILQSEFCPVGSNARRQELRLKFYGPLASSSESIFTPVVRLQQQPTGSTMWVDVAPRYYAAVGGQVDSLSPRIVRIGGFIADSDVRMLSAGHYRVLPALDAEGVPLLRCAGTYANPPLPVATEVIEGVVHFLGGAFEFDIALDCDADGHLNQPGDTACMRTFEGQCPADVDDATGSGNADGGVTIDDLLYYLNMFELGTANADLDDGSGTGTPDSGVTIEDLLFYLNHFEAGC